MHCPEVMFHNAIESGGKESEKIGNSEYQDLRIRFQNTHFHMFASWKQGLGVFFKFLSLKYFWKLTCQRCSWEQNQSYHPSWSVSPNSASALAGWTLNPANSLKTRQGSTTSFSKHPWKTLRRLFHYVSLSSKTVLNVFHSDSLDLQVKNHPKISAPNSHTWKRIFTTLKNKILRGLSKK